MFRVAVDRFCSRRPPPSPLGPPHSPYDGILVESALNFSQFVVQRIKNPNSNVGRTDADVDSVRPTRSVQSFQEKSLM